jgi:hypothetical protein
MWLCLCYCIVVYEWSTYRYWARDFWASRNAVPSRVSIGHVACSSCEVADEASVCCTDDGIPVFLHIPSSGDIGAPSADSRHILAVSAACFRCACGIQVARHICVTSACIGSTQINVVNVWSIDGWLLSRECYALTSSPGRTSICVPRVQLEWRK